MRIVLWVVGIAALAMVLGVVFALVVASLPPATFDYGRPG
jgi:hypothetical protein